MRARWWVLGLVVVCAAVAGCESSVPSFPLVLRDAGYECGESEEGSVACPSGEVCLQGFCYAQCSDTRPCGPREMCSSQGVCVASTTDAGPPPDAGPPDPCETTTCSAPTPFCRGGACLQCLVASDGCDASAPVCDLARGACVPFAGGALCTPCNVDSECTAPLVCLTRGGTAPTERVCVPTCAGGEACPAGFECEGSSMRCVPKLNFSCTGVRRALDAASCDVEGAPSDASCAPVGATPTTGLFVGACFADGIRDGFTCHVPCGAGGDADCPAGTCLDGYCR